MDDDDRRTPTVSAWTMPAVSASSSPSGTRRPRRSVRRAPVVACLVGAVVLLAGLGAAGPPTPVTAVEVLPPADMSLTGATGRLPDPTSPPLPIAPGLPPVAGAPPPDEAPASGSALGIPETVLAAYRAAATTVDRTAPGCRLTWPLVAGIGKVESDHAAGGAVDADGTTRRPILGPQLTGTEGNAAIRDTDGGTLDLDATWDRAVGPTQFIPSSWRTYGADGNGDGRADPDNVFDAGLATARYLCSSGGDLSGAGARHDAVFRYNHSEAYVATVLRWADGYASGALPVPDSTGSGSGSGSGSDQGSDGGAGGGLADGVLPDGPVVDGTPTLAALPSPSARIPAAGGVPTTAGVPGAPMITSSGATRPTIEATRSPSPDLAPAPSGTSTSATSSTPPVPSAGRPGPTAAAAAAPPGSPAPTSTTSPSATSPSATSPSATSPSATSPSATSPSATSPSATSTSATSATGPKPASSTPPPVKPVPPKPAPSTTTSSTATSSTTPSSTTTSSTAPTPAARCTAAVPALARASGLPAAQLTAASTAGPGTGRTTCTVRGPHGPLLAAVTAAPGAAAPSAPATGTSRTVAGGRTVLTVPTASGLPDDRAKAVLAAAAGAWG